MQWPPPSRGEHYTTKAGSWASRWQRALVASRPTSVMSVVAASPPPALGRPKPACMLEARCELAPGKTLVVDHKSTHTSAKDNMSKGANPHGIPSARLRRALRTESLQWSCQARCWLQPRTYRHRPIWPTSRGRKDVAPRSCTMSHALRTQRLDVFQDVAPVLVVEAPLGEFSSARIDIGQSVW